PLGGRASGLLTGSLPSDRVFLYGAALEALRDRPLLGFGPDNFGVLWPHYRPPGAAAAFAGQAAFNSDSAHSWLLQAAATTGVAGVVTLLVLVVVVIRRLDEAYKRGSSLACGVVVGMTCLFLRLGWSVGRAVLALSV